MTVVRKENNAERLVLFPFMVMFAESRARSKFRRVLGRSGILPVSNDRPTLCKMPVRSVWIWFARKELIWLNWCLFETFTPFVSCLSFFVRQLESYGSFISRSDHLFCLLSPYFLSKSINWPTDHLRNSAATGESVDFFSSAISDGAILPHDSLFLRPPSTHSIATDISTKKTRKHQVKFLLYCLVNVHVFEKK